MGWYILSEINLLILFCSFKTFSFSILEITEIMHDRCKVFKEKLNWLFLNLRPNLRKLRISQNNLVYGGGCLRYTFYQVSLW